MTELLTAAQMRAIEQAAIDSGEVTGLELMERAGRGVVEAILEEWPEMALTSQKAVVLCGPGNNGGDGFVVARLLKQRGWAVEVFLYGEVEKLPPDAKENAERWLEMGPVHPLLPDGQVMSIAYSKRIDIIVDSLFGTGLTRPFINMRNKLTTLQMAGDLASVSYPNPRMICIDVPSGICSDSGKALGMPTPFRSSLVAHLTVTFHTRKTGHCLGSCPNTCKKITIKDIGLKKFRHAAKFSFDRKFVHLVTPPAYFPSKELSADHKYAYGHALILSGPAHFTGAGRLAARGALRIGAGLVTLGCAADAMAENAAQLTSIMLAEVTDAGALAERLQDKRINVVCLGPGLGLDERARGLVEAALGGVEPHPTVLDADAITLLARNPALFSMLHDKVVLTPHAGEFKRLFPDIAAKLDAPATSGPAYSKVDATREAAKRAGCVVLFKGADTVIADPTGRAAINSAHYERAAPWLATAGSGDVLAGFITGLMARGFAPMQAAETGAWLHVECALKFGPGLIAEDIPEQLPAVFRDLGL